MDSAHLSRTCMCGPRREETLIAITDQTFPPEVLQAANWPDTFGDVTAEYAAAHEQVAFLGGACVLLWVSGPDAITYLQGIISQDVENMAPGQVARSFLLSPRGKLVDVFWVLRAQDRIGLVTTPGRLSDTQAELNRWKIRVQVDLQPDPRPIFQGWGPTDLPAGFVDTQSGWTETDGMLTAQLAEKPIRCRLLVGPQPDLLHQSGIRPMGELVASTIRVEVGEPVMGVDLDENTIPQESGLAEEAVSFTKGCFLGQELVARLDARGGRVNRLLRAVRILDTVIPPVGADVQLEGRCVGRLTTVGESLSVRAPVGLGLLHRNAQPDSQVHVGWEGGGARGVVAQLPLIGE